MTQPASMPTTRRSFDALVARLVESVTTLSERDLLQPTHWSLGEDARLREDVRFRETPWGRWMLAEDVVANDAIYRWLYAARRSSMALQAALTRAAELFGRRSVFCVADPRFVLRHDEVRLAASELSRRPVIEDEIGDLEKYTTHLPLHSLKAAAASVPAGEWGRTAREQSTEILGWVRVTLPGRKLNDRMFVAQIEGHSMDDGKSGLVDGGYAVFELGPSGSKQAPNVLVRGSFHDSDTGTYAVKKYVADERDAEGRHHRVVLVSLNPDKQRYPDIELDAAEDEAITVVAKVVQALAPDGYERQPKRKRTAGRRTIDGKEGVVEQGSRLERRIASFFDGAPPDSEDDDVDVAPTPSGWSSRLVYLDVPAGGLHVEVGPLTGLPSFVKKLRLVGTAGWDALVLAANACGRSTRLPIIPSKGPWRWEAVGFEEETDLGLERLALDALPATEAIVFRVDSDGIGQPQQGKVLALGQVYRLLLPPSLGAPGLGIAVSDGWRLWSVDLSMPPSATIQAWLATLGVNVGEAWPRLEWGLFSPAAWRTNAHGDRYPVFEAGDETFVTVRGLPPDDGDRSMLFAQGAEGTSCLALSGDGVVSLGTLATGRWACALVHARTSVQSATLMFEVAENATRYVDSKWSAAAPTGVASLAVTAPPGWPVTLRWRDALGESLLAVVHASDEGTINLDEAKPWIEDRARRARIADLIVDLGELGRRSFPHDGRASIAQVREALAALWQQRASLIHTQMGAWLTLVPAWFGPVTELFGYSLEPFAEEALPMTETAHGLAAWRLTVDDRFMGGAISRSTSRVLVLTTDLDAALSGTREWVDRVCTTATVREALVTDGTRWTVHRRGNRLRGHIWHFGEDLEQRVEPMLADLGEGVG